MSKKSSKSNNKVKTVVHKQETNAGRAIKASAAYIGATLGSGAGPVGGALGMLAGSVAGSLISQWAGQGDYSVKANSVLRAKNSVASFTKDSQSIVVRHREFIGTISGSTGFQVQYALPLNPGVETTFPWLAPIAAKYQQYYIRGMIFQYLPTSGTFSGTSSALGTVMMQTTYRATDDEPSNKVEMLNEYWSNESVASQTFLHAIECKPGENPFNVHYVRNKPVTSGEPLMYDMGKTFIATQGMDTTGVVGDLWCTYEIELKKPVVASQVLTGSTEYYRSFSPYTELDFFTSSTVTAEIGTTTCTFINRSIVFPKDPNPRKYYIRLTLHANSINVGAVASLDGAPTLSGGVTTFSRGGFTSYGTAITAGVAGSVTTATYEANVLVPANAILPTFGFPALVCLSIGVNDFGTLSIMEYPN